jgi:hypothetical protein
MSDRKCQRETRKPLEKAYNIVNVNAGITGKAEVLHSPA